MSNNSSPVLVWIRRDMRLADNPALSWASAQQKQLIVFYILEDAPASEATTIGGAGKWWLHHSLRSFQQALNEQGLKLRLFSGDAETIINSLLDQTKADTLVWNRRYEPWGIASDTHLKSSYQKIGITVKSLPGNVVHEPWTVTRTGNQPYRVFTAYWRASEKQPSLPVSEAIQPLSPYTRKLTGEVSLKSMALLPTLNWAENFSKTWQPGEAGAQVALCNLLDTALEGYSTGRDIPSIEGTSRLSPHLAFGEISPRQINAAIKAHLLINDKRNNDDAECYMREIGWRDFACHLIYHFPHTIEHPLDKRFERIVWRKPAATIIRRWQQGNTGIPLVDAGMRQLWQTGWMHNRVRMVVASLLIKNMGVHWSTGADWFWDTLVDADLASNTMGWQWVAGSGADAAPYFRIFNPVRQGERFDPEGIYVRRWVPEIARLPKKYIHSPWTASATILAEAGVTLGKNYPKPIVDLAISRREALERFDKIKIK